MVTNLSTTHSILSEWMFQLRDTSIQEDRLRFRTNIKRIGFIAGYEISKRLPFRNTVAHTPLGDSRAMIPHTQPVIAGIMRAGLPLQDGLLEAFDQADCAFLGAYRKHSPDKSEFNILQQYVTSPDLTDRPLILADTMLATGASIVTALDELVADARPAQIHIVCVIACGEGIDKVHRHYPEAHIWAGAIDDELTAKGYIVPGLGDAGDLCYGSKRQD